MNLIEFSKIISQPAGITKEQTKGLELILADYPYFQAAHFMKLYALKKYRSFKYNDALKKTAAYTTDRSLLFDYITTFDFDLHPATTNLLQSPSDETVKIKKVEQTEDGSDSPEAVAEETLDVGQPLNFAPEETYSFSEWLQLSQLKPIERSSDEQKAGGGKPRSNMDLIADFISKSPKISPSFSETYDDAALESTMENEQLMTETLARVYLEQKKYEKAIAAFTVLSLKYPEKSSFFADRIEAVRKLQNK